MSASLHRYRFATPAQWRSCLLSQVEQDPSDPSAGLHPFAPYALPGWTLAAPGAHAPARAPYGDVLWRDESGRLLRLRRGDDAPAARPAPRALARATRMVAHVGGIWAIGDTRGTLEWFDDESLSRLLVVGLSDDDIVDIADDGECGVLALAGRGCDWQCVRVDRAGHAVERIPLAALLHPLGIAYLRDAGQIVVLDRGHSGAWLRWYPRTGGGEAFNVFTPQLGTCFSVAAIGSDAHARLLVAGSDQTNGERRAHVIVLDADAETVADLPLSAAPTGVAGTRDSVVVTTAQGVVRFSRTTSVPDATPESRCTVITPVLRSVDTMDGRRWLRVEALAALPSGTTLEVTYAATDDPAVVTAWRARRDDVTQSQARRVRAMRDMPDTWSAPLVAHGDRGQRSDTEVPVAAPLFDVRSEYVQVCVSLIAPAGSDLPVLKQLDVLYPGRTLMESLPAIYQRQEETPGSFLRGLVGVLEATTQTLDVHIDAMGSLIHPATAPRAWLDFVARWLGLPWDDALSDAQKRNIATRANDILRGRGTRAGLAALLDALLPDTPPRYRIVDTTADYGFTTLGGAKGSGARLPAILSGLSIRAAELGSKAILGCMRLPNPGDIEDGTRHLVGRVRVEIAASAGERAQWEPWIGSMIDAMVPATARVALRWVPAGSWRGDQLDDTLLLEGLPAAPYLGSDAVTSQVHLPDRQAYLSATGAGTGSRLQ